MQLLQHPARPAIADLFTLYLGVRAPPFPQSLAACARQTLVLTLRARGLAGELEAASRGPGEGDLVSCFLSCVLQIGLDFVRSTVLFG